MEFCGKTVSKFSLGNLIDFLSNHFLRKEDFLLKDYTCFLCYFRSPSRKRYFVKIK